MKTNQASLLVIAGLLVIAASQIVAHYMNLPDFVLGAVTGVGIGLMIVSFLKSKKAGSF
nr:hypothetical protein [uncultured Fluviicola sp.]